MSKQINIRIDEDLLADIKMFIEAFKKEKGYKPTLTQFIILAIEKYLEEF